MHTSCLPLSYTHFVGLLQPVLAYAFGLLLFTDITYYPLSCNPQHADRLLYGHACFGHADYDILIAAGGDGTINQVVNELVDQDAPKEICLAVMPLGTANDFATSLTIHDDNLVQAMQTAVQGSHHSGCCSCWQLIYILLVNSPSLPSHLL